MPKAEFVGPGTPQRANEDAFALVRRDLALRILEECRTALMMSFRYLDVALWKMPFEAADISGALATDGFRIYFNASRVIARFKDSPDEMARDYLHLILHCVFRQPFETRRAHPRLWSYACDLCVEAIAMELCEQRFASAGDQARAEVLKQLKRAVESLTPAQLYRLLERVWDQRGDTRDAQELHKALHAAQGFFVRDSHERWNLSPLYEQADEQAPAEDETPQKERDISEPDVGQDDDARDEQTQDESAVSTQRENCPRGSQKAPAGDEALAESGSDAPSVTEGESKGPAGGAGAGSGTTDATGSSSGVGGNASQADAEPQPFDQPLTGEADDSAEWDAQDNALADPSDENAHELEDRMRESEEGDQLELLDGEEAAADDERFEEDLAKLTNNRAAEDEQDRGSYEEASLEDVDPALQERAWEDISKRIEADLETLSHARGNAAGNLMANLSFANRSRLNYADFLRQFARMAEDICLNDDEFDYVYYMYGLQRYGNMPLIEPLEYKESNRVREFVIAVDTSASCAGELVRQFITRTFEILKESEEFGASVNVHIVQCDAAVQEDTVVTSVDEFTRYLDGFTVKGMGGTDFRPVFAYVDELIRNKVFEDLRGLIYFTDGMGIYPDMPPDYDVAFVFVDQTGARRRVPPWAMRVVMDEDEIREL